VSGSCWLPLPDAHPWNIYWVAYIFAKDEVLRSVVHVCWGSATNPFPGGGGTQYQVVQGGPGELLNEPNAGLGVRVISCFDKGAAVVS
jgi:hypothetical protein